MVAPPPKIYLFASKMYLFPCFLLCLSIFPRVFDTRT